MGSHRHKVSARGVYMYVDGRYVSSFPLLVGSNVVLEKSIRRPPGERVAVCHCYFTPPHCI